MKKSLTNNGVVKVGVHPDTGLVITQNPNKPEFGSIRLDYKTATLSGGFSSIGNRSAFIHGRMEDLEAFGLKAGQELVGKIIKKESSAPFYDGQQPKINPQTNEQVLTNGRPTYLEFQYTEDSNAHDMWIDNEEDEVEQEVVASEIAGQTLS
jgi:hypothetical protein